MKDDDPKEGETRAITKVSARVFIDKCYNTIIKKYPHKGTDVVYPRHVLDTFGATWVRISLSNPSLSLSL